MALVCLGRLIHSSFEVTGQGAIASFFARKTFVFGLSKSCVRRLGKSTVYRRPSGRVFGQAVVGPLRRPFAYPQLLRHRSPGAPLST